MTATAPTRRRPDRPARASSSRCSSTTSTARAWPRDPTQFSGRSDYGPFIAVGIPAGGLFTGADGVKTAAQQATYGGTAGISYDPCYHLACDTYANNSDTALDQMSDAAAHAVLLMSRTKIDIAVPTVSALRTSGSAATADFDDNAPVSH